jgi:hypothetical protein
VRPFHRYVPRRLIPDSLSYLCINSSRAEANLQAGLDSDEGDYAMSEDGEEPKC